MLLEQLDPLGMRLPWRQ